MFKKSLLIMTLLALLAPWAAMGQSTVYSKITENKTDWSGTYVFANTTKSVGANTTLSSGRLGAVSVDIDATGNTITDKKSAAVYEITKSGNIYYITTTIDNTTYYLRKYKSGSSSYQLRLETSNEATSYYQWSLSYNATNQNVVFTNTGNNVTHYLICYAGSTQDFELNTSVNSGNYKAIDLYEEITITGCPIPSVTASSVGGRTATINWTYLGTDTHNNFEYICSETAITDFTGLTGTAVIGTSKELTGLTPETPYFCYVRTVCDATNNDYSDWSNACTFTTQVACPVPTGLTCTGYTATTATLEWSSTGAESYEIYLTTDETDVPTSSSTTEITSSTNSKNLENLTAETTYYAYVRGNCGTTDGESGWSAVCSFTPSAAVDITVNNSGTSSNSNYYAPFYGSYTDATGTHGQFIIPASELTALIYGQIKKLAFYGTNNYDYEATFEVKLAEVSLTTLDDAFYTGTMTTVYTGQLQVTGDNHIMEVDFSSNYSYMGGNLLVDFIVTNGVSGNYKMQTWVSISTSTNTARYKYSSSENKGKYLPTTTITYIPGSEPDCYAPKDLDADNITSSSADLSWTKSHLTTTCTLRYRAKIDGVWGAWINKNDIEDPFTSYTLSGLNANTQYEYQVMGACGEGDTDWSSSYIFTTDCGTVVINPSTPFPTEGFENTSLPTCWGGDWTTSTYYRHTGSRAAYSNSDDNADMYMPTIRINAGAAELKFWSYVYYPSGYGKNSVLVSTDDGDTFTEIWTPESVSASWGNAPVSISIPTEYLNTDIIIAFRYEYNTSVGTYSRHAWYIDDLTIIAYDNAFVGGTNNDWNTAANWATGNVATSAQNVLINASVEIADGTIAEANNITIAGNNTLTIADGGQLKTNSAVTATVKKEITGYGDETTSKAGWYFLASPVSEALRPTAVANMIPQENNTPVISSSSYDLYRFDQTSELEWENYKNHQNDFYLYNGHGYLYANSANVTLEFNGTTLPANEEAVVSLESEGASDPLLSGWNLVGNPFACNAYTNKSYYVLSYDETEDVLLMGEYSATQQEPVPPCAGILVEANGDENINFATSAYDVSANNGNLQMTVAQQATNRGIATIDKAMVSFNQGDQLSKFYFGNPAANIYIPQGNEDYAIAYSNAQGEMPVNFKARENGTFTLTVNPENVEMGYLHLIDNMTGADIDLLQTPSYSFNATTRDYESRFRLVFSVNGENGASTGSATFAFISNGSLIVNNEGQATLQVVDIMGRVLSSETINGSHSMSLNVAPGVYMIRLINGNNVKVQKIVVR